MPLRSWNAAGRPGANARGLAVALLLGATLAAASPAQTPAPGRSLDRWSQFLTDLACDYGLSRAGSQVPADVRHVRALLRAALRFDEKNVDALSLLYELACDSAEPGSSDEAGQLLQRIVAAAPENETALRRWLDVGARGAKTIEERESWVRRQLDAVYSVKAQAMVHVALAQLARQRLDTASARANADEARRLDPENADAARLAAELLDDDAPPAERVRTLLNALRFEPFRENLAWEAARALDDAGVADHAGRLYQHALALRTRSGASEELDPLQLLTLSENAVARGDTAAALEFARRAVRGEALPLEAAWYVLWLQERIGSPVLARMFRNRIVSGVRSAEEQRRAEPNVVAQAGWYYCVMEVDLDRAAGLAEDALARAPDNLVARRVIGWALAESGRVDEAVCELEPIAARDPYAAYRLATILVERGDADAPARLYQQLKRRPVAGFARELFDELFDCEGASAETPWRLTDAAAAGDAFDWRVLEFVSDPVAFIGVEATPVDATLRFGEPWLVDFTLTNRAGFPMLLGPDTLLNPVALLFVRVQGERVREFPAAMIVHLDGVHALRPGESVRRRQRVDAGPIRKFARLTPEQSLRVSVVALLDPVQMPDGAWRAGPAGTSVRPAFLDRLAAPQSRDAWDMYDAALAGVSELDRARALESMAALLGQYQRALRDPSGAKGPALPGERLRQRLLQSLQGGAWDTRVLALDALTVAGLDAGLVRAAMECLRHEHWLVRLLAVRLLARQGEAFAETAARIAAEDGDELVRELAASYCERWQASPQSAPADAPSAP